MAIAHIPGANASAQGANGGTTSAVDTTGANLIVIAVARYTIGGSVTVQDSKFNTWTPLTEQSNQVSQRLYYCYAPTVGTGHTFEVTGTGIYAVISVTAFSGVASSPFDVESGATANSTSTIQPGSITPSEDDCLIVSATGNDGAASNTINGGFTEALDKAYSAGNYFGMQHSWLIQTTAAASNPTTTTNVSVGRLASTQAAFKAAAGGGGSLAADAGSYSLTGTAATLLRTSLLESNSGSYSLTGSATTLSKGILLSCDSGTYTLTGSSATELVTRLLAAGSGSYSLTGSAATLTSSGGGAYSLPADSGTYTILGSDVTFSYSGATVTIKAGSWIRYRIIT